MHFSGVWTWCWKLHKNRLLRKRHVRSIMDKRSHACSSWHELTECHGDCMPIWREWPTVPQSGGQKCLHSPLHCNYIKLLYEMRTCTKLTCILQLQAARTRAFTSWTSSATRSRAWTSCKGMPVQCLALASTMMSLFWLPAINRV